MVVSKAFILGQQYCQTKANIDRNYQLNGSYIKMLDVLKCKLYIYILSENLNKFKWDWNVLYLLRGD